MKDLLFFYIPEWFFVALNLVILVLILTKIFWKPLNRILDERQSLIERGLADAGAAREAKVSIEADRAAFEEDMSRQTAEQMKEARVRAGHEYDRIVHEADEKSRKLIAAARIQSEQERNAMLEAAREEIIATSLEAAELLMQTNMDAERNRRIVEAYLDGAPVAAGKGAV